MPVPTLISELSQTAGSNSPAGTDNVSTADDHIRALAAFIAQLRDGEGFAAEATVASAATCNIGGANSLVVQITGTTTITSFGTNYTGPRFIRFAGALTLTHNATSLILPGAANISTAAGDTAIFVPQTAGWRCVSYTRAANIPKVAQTWQDLTASRAINTNYTNSTGQDIVVAASVNGSVATSTVAVSWTVGGVSNIGTNAHITGGTPGNTTLSAMAVVPAGATYQFVVTQGTLSNWRELR